MKTHPSLLLLGLLAAQALPSTALPVPAVASVSSYQDSVCNYAFDGANNTWVWGTTDTSQPPHYAEHASCPYPLGGTGGIRDQESGLSTTDALELHNGAPPGTSGAWTAIAPAGTKFTAITYEPYLGHEIDPSNYWSPALRADGTIIPGQTCLDTVQNDDSCFIGGPPGQGGTPQVITGLSAHQLSLGITCQAPQAQECITGATLHSAWAAMYGATITIADPTPPTLDQPTGTLWGLGTLNGYHHSNENVTTTAQDTGGGIQSIVLAADGTPTETYTAPCDYTSTQPCPLSTGPQTLTLPTTRLTDGTHTLTLTAVDAAGNTSLGVSQQIAVDNTPPTPPTELTATATVPGGPTFAARWSDAGQDTPITQATYQLCPITSSGTCTAPTPAPAAGPATATVPWPGVWTLSVWLTDTAGLSDPTQAAQTIVTTPIPAVEIGHSPLGADNPITTGSPQPSSAHTGNPHPPPVKLHLSITRIGRRLFVHLSGAPAGQIKVSYVAHRRHHLIASGVRAVLLRGGRTVVSFELSPAGARATIRVTIRMGRQVLAAQDIP